MSNEKIINITEEAVNAAENIQETVEVGPLNQVVEPLKNARMELTSKRDVERLQEAASSAGVTMKITKEVKESNGNDVIVYNCTLIEPTDHQLDVISRKVNIATWRDGITDVATKVTNFTSDVADFAVNGALAPTVVSVANCAGTVAPVAAKAAISIGFGVGTAAAHAGAEVLTTAIQSGTMAYNQLSNDESIKQCGRELKGLWAGVTSKLFGSQKEGTSKFARC